MSRTFSIEYLLANAYNAYKVVAKARLRGADAAAEAPELNNCGTSSAPAPHIQHSQLHTLPIHLWISQTQVTRTTGRDR
jgi:hypothetical protein